MMSIREALNEAFSNDFIENNIKACNSIASLREEALMEIDSMTIVNFNTMKKLFKSMTEMYVDAASIVEYCVKTIKEIKENENLA